MFTALIFIFMIMIVFDVINEDFMKLLALITAIWAFIRFF